MKRRRRVKAQEGATDDSCANFHSLLSCIQSPQGINPFLLRRLYLLLNCLCSKAECCPNNGLGLDHLTVEFGDDWMEVTSGDICGLSDVLFQELSKKFEQLFSALSSASSNKKLGDDSTISDICSAVEIVKLLLRCSLVVLSLLEHQQNYLLTKGKVLLEIFRKLSSVNFNMKQKNEEMRLEKSVPHSSINNEDDCITSSVEDFVASLHFLEPSDPCLHFVSSMIEVFLDELLVHGQLRSFLKLIDSAAPVDKMLFKSHYGWGDTGVLMEVISTHFSVAFHGKEVLEDFLQQLFFMQTVEYKYSSQSLEVGPTAATLLLLNPIILSAPKVLQAHLISLISETISNVPYYENWKPDIRLANCFFSAFENSIILYVKCIRNLRLDRHCRNCKDSVGDICGKNFQPLFDSVLSPVTRKKIDQIISRLGDFSESRLDRMAYKMKSDLVSSAIKYVKECQHVLDKSCQNEILSILSCIIVRASDFFNDSSLNPIGGRLEDLCVLASILKLMSSSLLEAIRYLRHNSDSGNLKSLRDYSSCKEYDFVLSKIKCFGNFRIHLPMQQLFGNMLDTNSLRHRNSKTMFLHFSGLLSLSFASGLDFLVKGCLLNLMAVFNLYVFEEGNLDPFRMLLDSIPESSSFRLPQVSIQQTLMNQKSSLVVASRFQAVRTLYLRSSLVRESADLRNAPSQNEVSSPADTMERAVGIAEEIEEACNGEVYLKCVLKDNVPDFDDLANFVACESGKDYSAWLKDREKYRKWKGEKMTVLRWKRKKRTWRIATNKKP